MVALDPVSRIRFLELLLFAFWFASCLAFFGVGFVDGFPLNPRRVKLLKRGI